MLDCFRIISVMDVAHRTRWSSLFPSKKKVNHQNDVIAEDG